MAISYGEKGRLCYTGTMLSIITLSTIRLFIFVASLIVLYAKRAYTLAGEGVRLDLLAD